MVSRQLGFVSCFQMFDFLKCSFLHQQVDVIDPQRIQALVWAIQVHQKATEGDVDLAVLGLGRSSSKRSTDSHVVT